MESRSLTTLLPSGPVSGTYLLRFYASSKAFNCIYESRREVKEQFSIFQYCELGNLSRSFSKVRAVKLCVPRAGHAGPSEAEILNGDGHHEGKGFE
jgi:hypothetical protein